MILLVSSFYSKAQNEIKNVRSIEVKGSSEMEITPDEIFINITLKEYKKAGTKVTLDKLESQLVKSIKKLAIEEEKLRVQNIHVYNWNWRKKRTDDFLGNKTFILELADLKKVNDLIELLDPEGLSNIGVQSFSHSNIEEFRRNVKIGAMKAAKEKATYLLKSVGENVGRIMEAQEIEYGYQQPMMRSNMAYKMESVDAYESDVDFRKIKVRAEMRVVFEISD